MSDSMDSIQFTERAKEDPKLREFLEEVAEDVAKQVAVEKPQTFLTVTGVDILFGVAAYALYRLLKDYLDHHRAARETEILKRQAEVVTGLTEAGFPPELAQATAVSLLNGIAKRTEDDPALKKALEFIGKGK